MDSKPQINSTAKAGSILAMVLSSLFSLFFVIFGIIGIVFGWWLFFLFLTLPFIIPYAFLMYYNVKFLKTGDSYIGAGIWALLYGGLIPGILILVTGADTPNQQIVNSNIDQQPVNSNTNQQQMVQQQQQMMQQQQMLQQQMLQQQKLIESQQKQLQQTNEIQQKNNPQKTNSKPATHNKHNISNKKK